MTRRSSLDRLRQWLHEDYNGLCEPTYEDEGLRSQGTVVLRPFVLHGDPGPGSILLIGFNPATRITLQKLQSYGMGLPEYKDALLGSSSFEENVYKRVSGDDPSGAHVRFQNLIQDLQLEFNRAIIMTNCYAYPSDDEKGMKRLLSRAASADLVRFRKDSAFARYISCHLPRVVEAADPGTIIVAVGSEAVKLMAPYRKRGYIVETIRHPSVVPERRGSVGPWDVAVGDLLIRLRGAIL